MKAVRLGIKLPEPGLCYTQATSCIASSVSLSHDPDGDLGGWGEGTWKMGQKQEILYESQSSESDGFFECAENEQTQIYYFPFCLILRGRVFSTVF